MKDTFKPWRIVGDTRVVASEAAWRNPLKWNEWARDGVCPHCYGKSTRPTPGRCTVCDGKGNIGPYRPRVFCASLADVFESRVLQEWASICDGYRINFRGHIESQWRGGHRGEWARMKTKPDYGGYQTVRLSKHPTLGDKTLKVHRLMMQAFVGDCPDGQVVRHLDGRRDNNVLWNLVYSTQSDNLSDRVAHGTNIVGERNGRSKLTESDVIAVRDLLSQGVSQSKIAAGFGVKQVAISRIKLGKSWSDKAPLSVVDEPTRTCVPGQMVDVSGRPAFIGDGGYTHCPGGESESWAPLTMQDVRNRLFRLIDDTPNLDWLLLTKRPENIARLMPPAECSGNNYHINGPRALQLEVYRPNVWLGTSVEDQATADERIPHLLKVPAAVRFLSVEPLLGPVDFFHGPQDWGLLTGIHWVIVGGESGPRARPCNVDWIRDIVQQCKAAGVPVFVKQLGASITSTLPDGETWPGGNGLPSCGNIRFIGDGFGNYHVHGIHDPKGGDWDEWPADLRVREFPKVGR